MSRKLLVPLLTAVFLAAPAAFGPAAPPAFSGAAQAASNYNSSKSNTGNVTFHNPNAATNRKSAKSKSNRHTKTRPVTGMTSNGGS
jgi:hypothetical protein